MTSVYESIADRLADQGYAITTQFLSQKEVEDILGLPDFSNGVKEFKKAGIGKHQELQINESIRGDYIQWIDKQSAPPALSTYTNRISELISYLNRTLFLSLKDFEMHMTIYPAGAFYKRHLDQFKKDDHRKLSVICYLNQEWTPDDGGQLKMYLPNEDITVLPVAGTMVCFRSDMIEHEVLPARKQRLSLTGWVLDQFTDLRHL